MFLSLKPGISRDTPNKNFHLLKNTTFLHHNSPRSFCSIIQDVSDFHQKNVHRVPNCTFFLHHFYKPAFWWAIQHSCYVTIRQFDFAVFKLSTRNMRRFRLRYFLVRKSVWKHCECERIVAWNSIVPPLNRWVYLTNNNTHTCD